MFGFQAFVQWFIASSCQSRGVIASRLGGRPIHRRELKAQTRQYGKMGAFMKMVSSLN